MKLSTLWRALWQTPAGPLLLAAQVALTLMVLANVGHIVYVRIETAARPTGMDMQNIFWFSSESYGSVPDAEGTIKFDLEYLNLLPGVIAATVSSGEPQTLAALRSQVSATAEFTGPSRLAMVYQTTDKVIDSLGLQLIKGRIFTSDSIAAATPSILRTRAFGAEVVITESLAHKLFGGAEQALGQSVYFSLLDGGSATVVGVVALLQGAPHFGPSWGYVYDCVLAPGIPAGTSRTYIVRTKAGLRDELMAKVSRDFASQQPGRYIREMQSLADTAEQGRAEDRHGAVIMAIISSFVLVVTMLGLFGFASLAVTTRRKEIGTRRALGATKADVFKLFVLENWLITTAGIITGSVLTLAFALQLRTLIELPALPTVFLVGAMALIWVASLLATLLPALRAMQVSPAVATRVT